MRNSSRVGVIGLPRATALALAAASTRIQLDEGETSQHFYLGGQLSGPGAAGRSIEQFARHIEARHAWFGKVELDDKTFQGFIKNFNEGTYGQDIQGDRNHLPGDGVMFKVERLFTEGKRLLGEISWTAAGKKCFEEDGFKYFSIDFTDEYIHPETGKNHGPLLFGVAMTPRPFIKNMTPSQGPGRLVLSEGRSVVYPDYLQITKGASMFKLSDFLAALRTALVAKKLSAVNVGIVLKQFEDQVKKLGIEEDKEKVEALAEGSEPVWLQLAEGAPAPGQGGQLSELQLAQITQGVNAALDARAASERQLAEKQTANRKTFTDKINAAAGLSDATKQVLLKQAEVITGAMSAEQVTLLADSALQLGNELEVQRKKAALGMQFNAQGQLSSVVVIEGGIGSQVHGLMREKLLLSDEHHQKKLSLPEEKALAGVARKILAQFDMIHAPRLEAEAKLLANDGSTNVADGQFPAAVQRQVIVELLADLKFMSFVQMISDPNAQAVTQIPYEQRNIGTIKNGAIVYEGQGIAYAGVKQAMFNAYITPRKIAMLMSEEMIHFSRSAAINWDAWARNIASNYRLMRDIICAAIANELQRSADAFEATAISNQAFTAQVNGTRTLFKTTSWPIVRPKANRDLQGVLIGSVVNPISMVVDGNPVLEYDGTNDQADGIYFQIVDYNLGYFRIVDEDGVIQTLSNGLVSTITYSAATNVLKFDIDNGSVEYAKHLNGLLNSIGRRKAMLSQQRFVKPSFSICSDTLHQTVTEAEQFEESHAKVGANLDGQGDLAQVKGIPVWGTNQPGVDLGDSRILIGESGTCSYSVAKPFVTGQPFEVVDANGKPTAEKQAYGIELSSIVVPDPIRNRLTSVIVYSATARAAV